MKVLELPDDAALDIFLLNANVFTEKAPLQSTISCSQVCAHWRALLLSTPSIWGRVLGIGELARMADAGRKEVLCRTGDALLWISALIRGHGIDYHFLVNSLLKDHWHRIEHLKIFINHPDGRDIWPLIERPAPVLRTFEFHSRIGLMQTNGSETPIFSDQAPLLQTFMSDCLPLNLSAPWLSGIRQLSLGSRLTVFDILTCLQSTPLLEILAVNMVSSSSRHDNDHLPIVMLPLLVNIYLRSIELQDCTALLRSIKPLEGCSVAYYPDHFDLGGASNVNTLRELLKDAFSELSSYLQSFVQVHRSKISAVKIWLDNNNFIFACEADTQTLESDRANGFWVRLSDEFQPFSTGAQAVLSTLISSCNFSFITALTLEIVPASTLFFEFPMATWLQSYFKSFPAVTELSVYEGTLRIVSTLSQAVSDDSEANIFPILTTLTLLRLEDQRPWFVEEESTRPVVQFLRHRKAIGLPITKLVCQESVKFAMEADLDELVDMTGVEVCVRKG